MSDDTAGWDTGITLRRTTTGYIWSIGIAADSNSQDDLNAAVDKAIVTDARLTANYGPIAPSDGHGRRKPQSTQAR